MSHENPLRPTLEPILASVEFESETHFDWFGAHINYSAQDVRFMKVTGGRPPAVAHLAQYLYDRMYMRGQAPVEMPWERRRPRGHRSMPGAIPSDKTLDRAFVIALHNANNGKGAWTDGWKRVEDKGRFVVVESAEGRKSTILSERFSPVGDGTTGRVRGEKGSSGSQQGWYYAFSDVRGEAPIPETLRVYWSVARPGALALMSRLTARLNQEQLHFRFKVPTSPSYYTRCDAGVLYVSRSDWIRVAPIVLSVHEAVLPYLRSGVPVFTKRVAHGLAVAEDPGDTESFGMNRCRLVAEALWDAHVAGAKLPDQRWEFVRTRFASESIEIDRPHLRSGGLDPFEFPSRPSETPVAVPELIA